MSRAPAVLTVIALLITSGLSPTLQSPPTPPSDADGVWLWPVADARGVLRAYRAPETRYGAGHRGVDIRATGEVRAPDAAVVRFAGFVVDRPVVSLTHGSGLVSSYEPVTGHVTVGEVVQRGEVIGTLGEYAESAHCAQACLHVGVRRGDEYLSPLSLFGEIPAAVLLPPQDGSR